MIENKFQFYSTLAQFKDNLRRKQIPLLSIVFVKDIEAIWTHNTWFSLARNCSKNKGYFISIKALQKAYPNPKIGDWAIVAAQTEWKFGDKFPITFKQVGKGCVIAACTEDGKWELTDNVYEVDVSQSILTAVEQYFASIDLMYATRLEIESLFEEENEQV